MPLGMCGMRTLGVADEWGSTLHSDRVDSWSLNMNLFVVS